MVRVSSDHIGDIRDLSPSTKLLFGQYGDASKIQDKDHLTSTLHVDEGDLKGRDIKCLRSSDAWQDIGSYKGLDFFGDGSLYLLDTPGVSVGVVWNRAYAAPKKNQMTEPHRLTFQHYDGHVAALVCVATGPTPRYFLLGGDVAHHLSLVYYDNPTPIGVYKSKYNPLSPFRETHPERLQSFEHDLGELDEADCLLTQRHD